MAISAYKSSGWWVVWPDEETAANFLQCTKKPSFLLMFKCDLTNSMFFFLYLNTTTMWRQVLHQPPTYSMWKLPIIQRSRGLRSININMVWNERGLRAQSEPKWDQKVNWQCKHKKNSKGLFTVHRGLILVCLKGSMCENSLKLFKTKLS